MEENNNEKISVSGADLLKDVVADEKAAKTAPKDTEKDKKIKTKRKIKKRKRQRTAKSSMPKAQAWNNGNSVHLRFVALLVLVNVVTTMLLTDILSLST